MNQPLGIDQVVESGPVIPLLVLHDAADGVPIATALVSGGLRVLEVTLRTAAGLDVIREMAAVEGAIVGAGTVLNARRLDEAVAAGAQFIVSPGLTEPLAKAAIDAGVPLLAGVATASEILMGLDLGLSRFKFFPAQIHGGAAALKAFAGPFAGVKFCPTGGVSLANAPSYLSQANVTCVGGSWLAPEEAISMKDWRRITTLAVEAAALRR